VKNRVSQKLTVFIILLFVVSGGGAKETSHSEALECNLLAGWHHWPPFQYMDDDQQPVGFQIQLVKNLAKLSGCKIRFQMQTFEQNQVSIKNGEIDLAFDVTPTQPREAFGYFSIPYRREMYVLYVWPSFVDKCRSNKLEDLIQSGFRLMLSEGVVYGDDIAKVQANASFNQFIQYEADNEKLLNYFIANDIDGIIEDPMVMAFNKRTHKKLRHVSPCQISVNTQYVSMMFSKKTVPVSIVDRFNQAIEKAKKSHNYLQLWGI